MEEVEELEAIDDGDISAVSPAPPRTSIPPPIPKQALERSQFGERRSPLFDGGRVSGPPPLAGRSSPPPLRSSLPPPPPPAGTGQGPSSGIYRIPEDKAEVERWQEVVRGLELKVRLRDDLINELKRSLEEHKRLVAAAEARAAEAEARAASAPVASADDLKRIKGIGPAFERKLQSLGVKSYADIAAWTEADVERISEALAILPQRIARDGWIESARQLQAQ